jgi:hypothetical protein
MMDDDFNPYAAPKSELGNKLEEGRAWSDGGVWREGRLLVMAKGAPLPDRCLKCNAPALGWTLKRTLSWHAPGWYLLVLVHILIYIIVALCVRKTAKVALPLCPEHRRSRNWAIAVGWITALLGIGLFVAAVVSDKASLSPPFIVVGPLFFLFGLLYGVWRSRPAVTVRIDDRFVWLKNVYPAFLAELPARPWA